mmetsp:Transcript_96071/g.184567  ORF Transcript_96071/g.184567 Transcript_96071/m.184567 type:complete len:260 (+) Transcript_96071:243-1022(+)
MSANAANYAGNPYTASDCGASCAETLQACQTHALTFIGEVCCTWCAGCRAGVLPPGRALCACPGSCATAGVCGASGVRCSASSLASPTSDGPKVYILWWHHCFRFRVRRRKLSCWPASPSLCIHLDSPPLLLRLPSGFPLVPLLLELFALVALLLALPLLLCCMALLTGSPDLHRIRPCLHLCNPSRSSSFTLSVGDALWIKDLLKSHFCGFGTRPRLLGNLLTAYEVLVLFRVRLPHTETSHLLQVSGWRCRSPSVRA